MYEIHDLKQGHFLVKDPSKSQLYTIDRSEPRFTQVQKNLPTPRLWGRPWCFCDQTDPFQMLWYTGWKSDAKVILSQRWHPWGLHRQRPVSSSLNKFVVTCEAASWHPVLRSANRRFLSFSLIADRPGFGIPTWDFRWHSQCDAHNISGVEAFCRRRDSWHSVISDGRGR